MSAPRNTAKPLFKGVWQVVRFNPWFYLISVPVLVALLNVLWWRADTLPGQWQVACWVLLAPAVWWVLVSLIVSWWIYDLSDWPRGRWWKQMIGSTTPSRILNVHSGFDETTTRLQAWSPEAQIISLDLFDPDRLTEKSIHRARALLPPLGDALKGTPEHWPDGAADCQVICFLLSAHEFRQQSERDALFHRAKDALSPTPDAAVILVEHVRDTTNFLAFGPGFTHFHSVKNWELAWTAAGFTPTKSLRITPFLRAWRLEPSTPHAP